MHIDKRLCIVFLWNSPHLGRPKTYLENKGSNIRYDKINITFSDWVKLKISSLECDDHIPRDDIFDYHPIRERNIYIISSICFCQR